MTVQFERLGQQEAFAERRRLATIEIIQQNLDERVSKASTIFGRQTAAKRERDAELLADHCRRGLDARDPIVGVERHQSAADVDRRRVQHFAIAQQSEFGGATTDIDV